MWEDRASKMHATSDGQAHPPTGTRASGPVVKLATISFSFFESYSWFFSDFSLCMQSQGFQYLDSLQAPESMTREASHALSFIAQNNQ
jgi:hypothetical protein